MHPAMTDTKKITAELWNRKDAINQPTARHAIEPKITDETHQSDPACLMRSSRASVPGNRASNSSSHGVGLSLSCLRIVPSTCLGLSSCARLAKRRLTATSVWLGFVNKTTNAKQTSKTRRKTRVKDIANSSNVHRRFEDIRGENDS